jgi:hypothetical protein
MTDTALARVLCVDDEPMCSPLLNAIFGEFEGGGKERRGGS